MDVGAGDGLFVYKSAQRDPRTFYIGIDANRRPLEKLSEKIHRRPEKGGLSNVLFVQASVEDLPTELDAIAAEVFVQFPWGSLLRGVAGGDETVLGNLRRLCLPKAQLHITIGIDAQRDRREWDRLELHRMSSGYIEAVLADRYLSSGFRMIASGEMSAAEQVEIQTSWARRLRKNPSRTLFRILAEAAGEADNAHQGKAY